MSALFYSDIANHVADTKTNIQLSFQLSTKYLTIFLIVTHSIFHKSGSSALDLAGALIGFITTPFPYTKFLY